ncbi:hypothetical protein [Saccharopolyspora shandongensis]|uniref:hypothetical protein n=1 Tax=Saccharopolyspora shandongensis TaxID=418495 RepID=UPI0033E1EE0F
MDETYLIDADGERWYMTDSGRFSLSGHEEDCTEPETCKYSNRSHEEVGFSYGPVRAVVGGYVVGMLDADGDLWVSDGAGRFLYGMEGRGDRFTRPEVEDEHGPVQEICGFIDHERGSLCARPAGQCAGHPDTVPAVPAAPDTVRDAESLAADVSAALSEVAGRLSALEGIVAGLLDAVRSLK